jgi:TIR domain-containing protein
MSLAWTHVSTTARGSIDFRILQKSPNLPLVFLRGVGLPDRLIDYLPSLLNQPIQFYSCFISYSVKDEDVAARLHADLQNKGVRCWFAPHDLPIGAKILDGIDEAIRLRDKVLLILSEHSIKSDWVEDEVTTAFEEERARTTHTISAPPRRYRHEDG